MRARDSRLRSNGRPDSIERSEAPRVQMARLRFRQEMHSTHARPQHWAEHGSEPRTRRERILRWPLYWPLQTLITSVASSSNPLIEIGAEFVRVQQLIEQFHASLLQLDLAVNAIEPPVFEEPPKKGSARSAASRSRIPTPPRPALP